VNLGIEAGRWKAHEIGFCRPTLVSPGIEATPWTLKRLPKPGARTIHLILHTGSCNPEDPSADIRKRLDHIEFAASPRAIRLLALIRDTQLAPGQICFGVGFRYPLTVRLPDRLGRRVLRDAAFAPSERIADLRTGRCFGHCGQF
jgi:hypothetical protein